MRWPLVALCASLLAIGVRAPRATAQQSGHVEARTVASPSYGRARRIPPVVAVLVDDSLDRLGDRGCPWDSWRSSGRGRAEPAGGECPVEDVAGWDSLARRPLKGPLGGRP